MSCISKQRWSVFDRRVRLVQVVSGPKWTHRSMLITFIYLCQSDPQIDLTMVFIQQQVCLGFGGIFMEQRIETVGFIRADVRLTAFATVFEEIERKKKF